jgi:hypothetical protein
LLGIDSSPQLDATQEPGHIRVILGTGYQPPSLGQSDTEPSSINSAAPDASTPTQTPDQGQPVNGGAIPCVD